MSRSQRKLVGTILMLAFLVLYAWLALKAAEAQSLQAAPWFVQAICFGLLGIAWALPLVPLIWWMERGGRDRR